MLSWVMWQHSLGDVVSALTNVANWHFFFSGQSYASLFRDPSPVLHFWSLAIEEQFYVSYPLLVRKLNRETLWRVLWGLVQTSSGYET